MGYATVLFSWWLPCSMCDAKQICVRIWLYGIRASTSADIVGVTKQLRSACVLWYDKLSVLLLVPWTVVKLLLSATRCVYCVSFRCFVCIGVVGPSWVVECQKPGSQSFCNVQPALLWHLTTTKISNPIITNTLFLCLVDKVCWSFIIRKWIRSWTHLLSFSCQHPSDKLKLMSCHYLLLTCYWLPVPCARRNEDSFRAMSCCQPNMLFCVILYGKRNQSCFYVIKNLFRMNSLVEILSERWWSWCWWRCESGITKLFSLSGLTVQKVITFQRDHVVQYYQVLLFLCCVHRENRKMTTDRNYFCLLSMLIKPFKSGIKIHTVHDC